MRYTIYVIDIIYFLIEDPLSLEVPSSQCLFIMLLLIYPKDQLHFNYTICLPTRMINHIKSLYIAYAMWAHKKYIWHICLSHFAFLRSLLQVASHSRRCSSCNMQRASRAMLHKIRKIVTHKYAHIPHTLLLPLSRQPSLTLQAARCMPHAALRLPHTAPRRHRGRQSASGARPQVLWVESGGGGHLHWQHASERERISPSAQL